MPAKPKPTKQPKGKKRQRVLVRYDDGHYEMCFRSDVGDGAEKVYALGTKYIGEHAALVDILDKLCSDIVRRRDGFQCVLCGSRQNPQNGHVLVRGKWGTRWALDNQFCQCDSCNIRHGKAQQAHYYYNWYMSRFGVAKWEELCKRAESRPGIAGKDWAITELRALLEHYEDLYDRLCSMAVHDEAMLKEIGLYG